MTKKFAGVLYTCRACNSEPFESPLTHLVTEHPTHVSAAPLGMLYDQIMVVPQYEEE